MCRVVSLCPVLLSICHARRYFFPTNVFAATEGFASAGAASHCDRRLSEVANANRFISPVKSLALLLPAILKPASALRLHAGAKHSTTDVRRYACFERAHPSRAMHPRMAPRFVPYDEVPGNETNQDQDSDDQRWKVRRYEDSDGINTARELTKFEQRLKVRQSEESEDVNDAFRSALQVQAVKKELKARELLPKDGVNEWNGRTTEDTGRKFLSRTREFNERRRQQLPTDLDEGRSASEGLAKTMFRQVIFALNFGLSGLVSPLGLTIIAIFGLLVLSGSFGYTSSPSDRISF